MTLGPTVLRNTGMPFLTIAGGIVVAYFVIKAILMPGPPAVFSLIMAAIFVLLSFWWYRRSQQSSVIIDGDTVTINRGRQTQTFRRSDIAKVDLSSASRQLTFGDGTGTSLPLEGRSLVEAGILLNPRQHR